MDNDVSAGSSTATIAGRLALGVTLLAFGLGYTDLIDGVTAADAVSIAHYVGGVALFAAGLLALRDRDAAAGTAYTVLGAFSPGRSPPPPRSPTTPRGSSCSCSPSWRSRWPSPAATNSARRPTGCSASVSC